MGPNVFHLLIMQLMLCQPKQAQRLRISKEAYFE
jgi:hypothetical protein